MEEESSSSVDIELQNDVFEAMSKCGAMNHLVAHFYQQIAESAIDSEVLAVKPKDIALRTQAEQIAAGIINKYLDLHKFRITKQTLFSETSSFKGKEDKVNELLSFDENNEPLFSLLQFHLNDEEEELESPKFVTPKKIKETQPLQESYSSFIAEEEEEEEEFLEEEAEEEEEEIPLQEEEEEEEEQNLEEEDKDDLIKHEHSTEIIEEESYNDQSENIGNEEEQQLIEEEEEEEELLEEEEEEEEEEQVIEKPPLPPQPKTKKPRSAK